MGSSVELVGAWVDCAGLWRRVDVTASVFGGRVVRRLGEAASQGLLGGTGQLLSSCSAVVARVLVSVLPGA